MKLTLFAQSMSLQMCAFPLSDPPVLCGHQLGIQQFNSVLTPVTWDPRTPHRLRAQSCKTPPLQMPVTSGESSSTHTSAKLGYNLVVPPPLLKFNHLLDWVKELREIVCLHFLDYKAHHEYHGHPGAEVHRVKSAFCCCDKIPEITSL
jgi:hypothetical protein